MLAIDLSIDKVENNATAAGAYYKDMGTYYEIKFPGSAAAITVLKYYDTATIAINEPAEDGTVSFTVTGNFPTKPEIYATCEGNWTSTAVEITTTTYPATTVAATVKVSPTTAYVGDQTIGKLTIYVPYFGKTAMGQKSLSAKGANDLTLTGTGTTRAMEILPKKANDTKATVTFELEGEETASPSNGSCTVVLDQNYTLTNIQTIDNEEVETGSGFSGSTGEGWLSAGAFKKTNGTYTQEINLVPNTTDTPRTGAVIVYSPSGREVTRFVIRQEAKADDIEPINLVETNGNKSANCYIITQPGRYQIDTYMGAFNSKVSEQDKCTGKPDVIWNVGGNDITPCHADFSDNQLIFDVKGTIKPGNAVIGIRNPKDENDILWSWHIWFCEPKEDPRLDENTDKYPERTNVNVMNRALGAVKRQTRGISSTSVEYWKDGLFYQSGRKDPIRFNSDSTAAYDELPKNSDVEFDKNWSSSGWTESKSPSDPCPPGYKVPTTGIWRSGQNNGIMESISNYMLTDVFPYNVVSSDLNNSILYPYYGHLGTDGAVGKPVSNGTTSDLYGDGPLEFLTALVPTVQLELTSKPDEEPYEFEYISYIKHNLSTNTYLWGTSNTSLEYGYVENGIEITGYRYRKGTWKSYTSVSWEGWRPVTVTKWRANYSDNWIEVKTNAEKQLTSAQREAIMTVLSLDLQNIASSLTKKVIYNPNPSNASNSSAKLVRCVKGD